MNTMIAPQVLPVEKPTTTIDLPARGLSPTEAAELGRLEEIVTRGATAFIEVGSALAEISAKRLYRGFNRTFESYVRAKWGWGRARAYQLIAAAEVAGDVYRCKQPIVNEAQARILARVPKEKRAEAWSAVLDRAAIVPAYSGPRARPVTAQFIEETLGLEPAKKPAASDPGITVNVAINTFVAVLGSLAEAVPHLSPLQREAAKERLAVVRLKLGGIIKILSGDQVRSGGAA